MTNDQEKILVRQFYEIINEARFDELDAILGPKVTWHDPLLPGGIITGVEAFKNVLRMFRSAFPDLHITIEDQIQEDEKVVTRFSIQGTHRGDLMGIEATGKKFKVSGISIIRFEQGRVVEEWIEEDGLGLMRQLGVAK